MAQQINDNFQVLAALPIDDRTRKTTISERDAISPSRRFTGLQCFVDQTQTLYQLQSGILNSNWVGIAGLNMANNLETVIEGFYVLSAVKTTPLDWEVGDKFRGWIGNRYVVGEILTLPVSLPSDIDNAAKVNLAVDSDAINDFDLLYEKLVNKATDFTTVNDTLYPSVEAVKEYADALLVGVINLRGLWDASTNLFPTTGGSGTAGAVKKGDLWYVSVAGVLAGKPVNIGDSFFALVNTPGQTSANWNILESNIGYVPANDANVIHTTGNETKTGELTVNALNLPSNPINTSPFYIGQSGTSDNWKIYGYHTLVDQLELVFEVGDNGFPYASTGERFRFHYNAPTDGSPKDPFIIDYNDITANTNVKVTGDLALGATVADGKLTVESSVTKIAQLGSNASGSSNRLIVNAASNGIELDTRDFNSGALRDLKLNPMGGNVSVGILAGTGTRQVVADASGNLSATDIAPTSGTYTPTITGLANFTSSTFVSATYTVIGNSVTVLVDITVKPAAASTLTEFSISLPITVSTFVGTQSSIGVGTFANSDYLPIRVSKINSTTAKASFKTLTDANSGSVSLIFTYQK